MIGRFIFVFVFGLGAVALAAPLHLNFIHVVGEKPLLIDSLRYENSGREIYSLTRLDWLATGFSLTTASGKMIALPGKTAFIPLRGGSLTLPGLPAEDVVSITFHIGPDASANHSDPAGYPASHPLHPEVNKLHWDWQGGYIFMAIEGHWRKAGEKLPGGFAYHFARIRGLDVDKPRNLAKSVTVE